MIRILTLALSLLFTPAYADGKVKKPTISPWLYKKLQNSEKLIAKKSYSQAEQKLKVLLQGTKEKSYEKALVLRSLSSVYALNNQYKKAATALARALALNVLPQDQKQSSILNLGQLYMAANQYSKAIQVLEPWLAKNQTSNVQINVLIANAYTQLKKYRRALPFIKKAISKTKKPPESWYQLNLALYYELNNYSSASKILKKLIVLYPNKKQYWDQLFLSYHQLKQYKKAVSIQHLAYKKGFINKEKEILNLVNLFLYVDSPYKAANLLKHSLDQKEIKYSSRNWESLAHAWTMAKEFSKAIQAYEIASNLSERGSLYQQLGQIYVEKENWPKAIQSFNKALSKGNLKDSGATFLLLGMSYYENNNAPQAKKYLLKASNYSKHKTVANQWLKYITEAT